MRHTFCNVGAAIFSDRIEDLLVFHLEVMNLELSLGGVQA